MGSCSGPMRLQHRVSAGSRGRLLRLLSVVVAVAFLAPYGIGLISQTRGAEPAVTPALTPDQGSVITASVTWNGVNVDSYPTVSSAASWSFDNLAYVTFNWLGAPIGSGGVSQAFLVILFLGFPAYTKQQVQSVALPVGSINMTYNLQQFKWYLQGVYELHAYLENPAGNSLFSENFYVRVTQPYDFVVATVGLLLLTIAELYLIATVGPRAMDKTRKAPMKPQPKQEEPGTSTDANTAPSEKT
jgi:hypothetical protein